MNSPRTQRIAQYAKQGLAVGGIGWLVWSLLSSGALAAYVDKEMLRQWGPLFILAMTALVMYDRNSTRQIQALESHATAMRELALSVNRVAERDDAFQREQDALLNHVAIELGEAHTALKGLIRDCTLFRAQALCRPTTGNLPATGREEIHE